MNRVVGYFGNVLFPYGLLALGSIAFALTALQSFDPYPLSLIAFYPLSSLLLMFADKIIGVK